MVGFEQFKSTKFPFSYNIAEWHGKQKVNTNAEIGKSSGFPSIFKDNTLFQYVSVSRTLTSSSESQRNKIGSKREWLLHFRSDWLLFNCFSKLGYCLNRLIKVFGFLFLALTGLTSLTISKKGRLKRTAFEFPKLLEYETATMFDYELLVFQRKLFDWFSSSHPKIDFF